MKYITQCLATFFYVGYWPVAPGSMATLVGVFICYALHLNLPLYIAVMVAVTAIGFVASDHFEKAMGRKDPGCIVIDEVSGVMIAFFLVPLSLPVMAVGYFLFRAFDMFKIYPGNKLEAMGGGVGIMMDDVMAGIYTNVILQVAIRLVLI